MEIKCLSLLSHIVTKLQVKIISVYYFLPFRLAKIQKIEKNVMAKMCKNISTFLHC